MPSNEEPAPNPLERERQLMEARAASAVAAFAAGFAHAFNNALGGIIGFAELARQDAHDPAATSAHLDHLMKAARKARAVVHRVLEFSRLREQAPKPVAVQALLVEALPRWRAEVPAHIEIVTRFDPDAPPVLADAGQLEQAVENLVTNASAAIGEKLGRIEIALAPADAPAPESGPDLPSGRYVRLSVRDDGSGMNRSVVGHIFEPFFTTSRPGRGVGLGLAMVDVIVKATGGAIRVETEPDRGTTFHLYFPAFR